MWWYGFVALAIVLWASGLLHQVRRIADAVARSARLRDLDMRRRYGDDYDEEK